MRTSPSLRTASLGGWARLRRDHGGAQAVAEGEDVVGACVDGAGPKAGASCSVIWGPGPAAAGSAIGPDLWCHWPPAPPGSLLASGFALGPGGCLTFRIIRLIKSVTEDPTLENQNWCARAWGVQGWEEK